MRQSLFILFLLASLPAALVQAEPFAEYNPATGDIVLKGLSGFVELEVGSKNGLLAKDIASRTPLISPAVVPLPAVSDTYIGGPGFVLRWTPGSGASQFLFDSLSISPAVQPFTTAKNELRFGFRSTTDPFIVSGEVRVVPEPSTMTLAAAALIGVLTTRRRWMPLACRQ